MIQTVFVTASRQGVIFENALIAQVKGCEAAKPQPTLRAVESSVWRAVDTRGPLYR